MALAGLILGIVVAVIILLAIVAAIAIPNILASKVAANESSAIANLRVIGSREELHMARSNKYGTLAELEAAGSIDSALAQATSPERAKSGYYYTMTAEGYEYQCIAKPQRWGLTGIRIFKIGPDGTIYYAMVENPGEDDWEPLGGYR